MESDRGDSIADGVTRQLDPRWISVHRIYGAIVSAAVAMALLVGLVALWIASGILWLGLLLIPLWLLVLALLAWRLTRWPELVYQHTSYRVDDVGIEIVRGVYWRTITNIPRSRIQHTDVWQGPIERRHGLGTLVVYTAGTQHSQVTLHGLEFSLARRIRTHLLPSDTGDAV